MTSGHQIDIVFDIQVEVGVHKSSHECRDPRLERGGEGWRREEKGGDGDGIGVGICRGQFVSASDQRVEDGGALGRLSRDPRVPAVHMSRKESRQVMHRLVL